MKLFSKILAFLLVAVANIGEIVAIALVTEPGAECPGSACIIHIFSAVLIFLAFALYRVQIWENEDSGNDSSKSRAYANPIVIPAFFLAVFIPMFGILTVSILGFIIKPKNKSESPIFQDYIEYVKNIEEEAPRFDKSSEEQIILKLLEIEPVVDLINSSSKNAVWGSIENLSQRTDQGAVSLIRESIKQNDAEVKFLASIGIEKMEDQFQQKITQAENELKKNHSTAAACEYLKTSIAYLKSGLTSIELNRSLLNNLLKECNQYLAEAHDSELLFLKVQLLDLAGDKQKSLDLLNAMLAEHKIARHMVLSAAEIFFSAGRIKDVRRLLTDLDKDNEASLGLDRDEFETDLDEFREFWLPGEQNL